MVGGETQSRQSGRCNNLGRRSRVAICRTRDGWQGCDIKCCTTAGWVRAFISRIEVASGAFRDGDSLVLKRCVVGRVNNRTSYVAKGIRVVDISR